MKAISLQHALYAHNAILNYIEKQPKIEGRFSHGETL